MEPANRPRVSGPTGDSQEYAMPYLFWAVLPFALMDTWWGMCEQRRDTE